MVVVDAFGAVAPDGIVRLFGRGRSAGMSLLLGPQELADLALAANPNLKDQVLGNLTTLIAHRQLIPDSAEQIAAIDCRPAFASPTRSARNAAAEFPDSLRSRRQSQMQRLAYVATSAASPVVLPGL